MAKKKPNWCSGGNITVVLYTKNRHVRCSKCNRRLIAGIVTDEDNTKVIGYKVPPHKEK